MYGTKMYVVTVDKPDVRHLCGMNIDYVVTVDKPDVRHICGMHLADMNIDK